MACSNLFITCQKIPYFLYINDIAIEVLQNARPYASRTMDHDPDTLKEVFSLPLPGAQGYAVNAVLVMQI